MDFENGPVGLLRVDSGDGRPLREQLEQALRTAIRSGRLGAGTRLPSTRELSARLGISRGVVTAAYGQLAAEGYLSIRQGAAVRVSDAIRGAVTRPAARALSPTFAYDMRPLPDLAGFPRDRWLRSLTSIWRRMPTAALGEVDPRGLPELRDALAAYLDRVRGTAADPELVLITAGFTQGLSLACRALRSFGVERIAVEDPGWHNHHLIIEQSGLAAVPVPVDADGLDVSALENVEAEAVVVTPAHQFPTGAMLARERRAALLRWAERGDRLIIEDDYDAELRYDGIAVGALQGLAPDRVLYVGSASKRLAPGLRLGWMLLPSWLTWPMVSSKSVEDGGSDVLGQLALTEFINRGDLDRHLRRMRLTYAARRQSLLTALDEHLPLVHVGHDAAGLHEVLHLPASIDEPTLLAAAARYGVGLEGLSWHRHAAAGAAAVLAGYANLPPAGIEHAVQRLARAVNDS